MKNKEMNKVSKKFSNLYEHGKATTIGNLIFKITEKQTIEVIKKLRLKKNSKILDIGCGIGRTLNVFRKNGFYNSIGIDNSKKALALCKERNLMLGKDVFLIDAKKTKFPNKKFDLVFEEGLLEHFKNFQPFVDEMCRISGNYVVLIQPNKFSLAHKVMDLFTDSINIKEFSYKIDDFSKSFLSNNFKLVRKKNSFLNIFWILVFKRK